MSAKAPQDQNWFKKLATLPVDTHTPAKRIRGGVSVAVLLIPQKPQLQVRGGGETTPFALSK